MTDTGRDQARREASAAHTYRYNSRLVIEAVGPVTLGCAGGLEEALRSAVDAGERLVTVDFRQVRFMDSCGLDLLVEASRRLRSEETPRAPRVVVTAGGQPERVLRLGMFGKILEITHELEGEPAW